MAQGLQIWDENGNLTFDTSLDTCEYLGEFTTTTTNGSFVVSGNCHENIWIIISSRSNSNENGYGKGGQMPAFSISGNTISWNFPNYNTNQKSICVVSYGSYGG